MSTIHFTSKLSKIGSWTILILPKEASHKLPSRGMTMVDGTIKGFHFKSALEPDGKGSHWLKFDKSLLEAAKADVGEDVTLSIEPTKDWPEPKVPDDLKTALESSSSQIQSLWEKITPMARWDWIRWINSTKNTETRKRRIEVACSKLKAGTRRPCCFNRTMCTEPEVSNNGVLLEPPRS
jgi:hypothetical protein